MLERAWTDPSAVDRLRGGARRWTSREAAGGAAIVRASHSLRRMVKIATPGQRILGVLLAGYAEALQLRLRPGSPDCGWWLSPASKLLEPSSGEAKAAPAQWREALRDRSSNGLLPTLTAEMAGGAASHLSRGGMTTKIEAGKIATQAGTAMIIAKGTPLHPLRALTAGGLHTLFAAAGSRAQARKRWIMGTLELAGQIYVDAGAAKALLDGRSLLPIGVTRVTGEFLRGDAVAILDPSGREIARGLVGLDREEADLVKGKNSKRTAELLGLGARSELVHRDNMVVLMGLEAKTA